MSSSAEPTTIVEIVVVGQPSADRNEPKAPSSHFPEPNIIPTPPLPPPQRRTVHHHRKAPPESLFSRCTAASLAAVAFTLMALSATVWIFLRPGGD
ncbi:hypothetical protein DFS34DRAFT_651057 [Phlyctochytrium arcticum]|nr:hypothetical protein DFS34DRAFT_651057 [Phlyctochytrium arcticum]